MFPDIGPVKKKNSHSPARLIDCVSEYTFLISENKQKKQESEEAKETKEEKRVSPENRLKNKIFGCPGEDFSCHPHFRKQEY